jgi:hypothetical protein
MLNDHSARKAHGRARVERTENWQFCDRRSHAKMARGAEPLHSTGVIVPCRREVQTKGVPSATMKGAPALMRFKSSLAWLSITWCVFAAILWLGGAP